MTPVSIRKTSVSKKTNTKFCLYRLGIKCLIFSLKLNDILQHCNVTTKIGLKMYKIDKCFQIVY